jgi:hypothetical protein
MGMRHLFTPVRWIWSRTAQIQIATERYAVRALLLVVVIGAAILLHWLVLCLLVTLALGSLLTTRAGIRGTVVLTLLTAGLAILMAVLRLGYDFAWAGPPLGALIAIRDHKDQAFSRSVPVQMQGPQ